MKKEYLQNIPIKNLSRAQQNIIKKLNPNREIEGDIDIYGFFIFSATKEGLNYWNRVTLEEFERDRLFGKFNYLNPKKELGDKINEIINKLQKIK